jgi:hypothetical protein
MEKAAIKIQRFWKNYRTQKLIKYYASKLNLLFMDPLYNRGSYQSIDSIMISE